MKQPNQPQPNQTHDASTPSDRVSRGWGDFQEEGKGPGRRGITIFFIGFVVVSCGVVLAFISWKKPTRPVAAIPRPSERVVGPAISADGIPIVQSVLEAPTGEILLDHFPTAFETVRGFDRVLPGEVMKLHFEPGNPWYEGFNDGNVLTSFNCGTFAVGPFIGLTQNDVLDGEPKQDYPNPMDQVLADYFRLIADIPLNSQTIESFKNSAEWNDDDVVILLTEHQGQLYHMHAGRIDRQPRESQILSKLGRRGPIVQSNLQYLLRYYPSSRIRVFRFDPARPERRRSVRNANRDS